MDQHRRVLFSIGILFAILAGPSIAGATDIHARFDLDDRRGSPFPSDRFTVADPAQNTGLRVKLPKPDCTVRPTDCADLDVINTLDGFNVQPRLSIPFDGPIDPASVNRHSVFLVRLANALPDQRHHTLHQDCAGPIGINQVVWDVASNVLYAESDEMLEQHTRYALFVTRDVRDVRGHSVQAVESFRKLRGDGNSRTRQSDPNLMRYRAALLDALSAARSAGVQESAIVAASVFTTQSVTAVLEKIRAQIAVAPPPVADFLIGPGGTRAVYPISSLTAVNLIAQTGTAPTFNTLATPFVRLAGPPLGLAPGAAAALAFGKYESPDYMTEDRYIPRAETRVGAPVAQGTNEIFFNLILPSGTPPPHGWPVAIYGHGATEDKQTSLFIVAARLAAQGVATIGINAVGRGFGPLGTLMLVGTSSPPITLPGGGRGIDTNNNGQITSAEGHLALAPRTIIRQRDARIQTAADLMRLVRVIQAGVDVDGDGVPDLDPDRIYYLGFSYGAIIGGLFLATEPDVRVGVLTAPGGPEFESFRLSPASRSIVASALASRVPSLINGSGMTFDENMPLRNLPPVVNTVPGAMEIQEFLDNYEWVGQSGDAVSYATHLRRAPLPGVAPKSVIVQYARGDRTLPNPVETAVVRAGDLADRTTFYRFDLFLAENPTTPAAINDPHGLLITTTSPSLAMPDEVRAALTAAVVAAQDQIATFFASDGTEVVDPDGAGPLFETPIEPPLPEDVVFFP